MASPVVDGDALRCGPSAGAVGEGQQGPASSTPASTGPTSPEQPGSRSISDLAPGMSPQQHLLPHAPLLKLVAQACKLVSSLVKVRIATPNGKHELPGY